MRTRLLLSLAVALLATSCKKDDPAAGLPPATQVGANTGGCLINGERFVATGWDSGSVLSNPVPPLSGGFFYDSLYYLLVDGVYKNRKVELSLFFRSQIPGVYPLNQNTPTLLQGGLSRQTLSHATFTFHDAAGEAYVTSVQHTGRIELTYANRNTGVSAGTFEFTAASTFDPGKTITITSGRFDSKQ